MKRRISLFLITSFSVLLLFSCKTSGHSEKFYEKQDKKKAEMEQQEYDKRVKAHHDMQSKDTQKMLKKTEKEAKKRNKTKKPKLKKC